MAEEKFLIDTNALIEPFTLYYALDLAPSFWDKLYGALCSGQILMLDLVEKELNGKQDNLSKWLKDHGGFETCKHTDADIWAQQVEVINYVMSSGYYLDRAVDLWDNEKAADAWLIAAAMARGYTIVTFEKRSGGLSIVNKQSRPKIPDVANHFGVKTVILFEMMRALGISI